MLKCYPEMRAQTPDEFTLSPAHFMNETSVAKAEEVFGSAVGMVSACPRRPEAIAKSSSAARASIAAYASSVSSKRKQGDARLPGA